MHNERNNSHQNSSLAYAILSSSWIFGGDLVNDNFQTLLVMLTVVVIKDFLIVTPLQMLHEGGGNKWWFPFLHFLYCVSMNYCIINLYALQVTMPSPWRRRSRMQGTMDWHRRRASSSLCRSGTTWRKTSSMKMNRSRSSFRSVEDLYRVLTSKCYNRLLTYLISVSVYTGTCTVRGSLPKTSLLCKGLRYALLLKNCCCTTSQMPKNFWTGGMDRSSILS